MKYLPLAISLLVPFGVAYLGSSVTTSSIDGWYQILNKPSFSPPNWVFAPVWTILFLLMGIASYLVWQKQKKIKLPLKLYGVQLVLNFFWSYFFFGRNRPGVALVDIIFLWIFIFLTTGAFAKVNKLASYLLYPYLAWVGFAALLNLSIFLLN